MCSLARALDAKISALGFFCFVCFDHFVLAKRFQADLSVRKSRAGSSLIGFTLMRMSALGRELCYCDIAESNGMDAHVVTGRFGSVPPVHHHDKLTLAPLPASVSAAAY